MGQKVNPNGMRFGINREWQSRWNVCNSLTYREFLLKDQLIRNYFLHKNRHFMVDHVEIERIANAVKIFVYCAQPSLILGKTERLNSILLDLQKINGRQHKIDLQIITVHNAALSAQIIAQEIANAIENRVLFRIAQKSAIKKVMAAGALGIKTRVSGRLGGVEIARSEGYSEGIVPLATLRSNIDYAIVTAKTIYGIIGVKVWINRGLHLEKGFMNHDVLTVKTADGHRSSRPEQQTRKGASYSKQFPVNS